MRKEEYLHNRTVQDFINWLATHLISERFSHSYTIRKNKKDWTCSSIYDAYKNYEWGFSAVPDFGFSAGYSFLENTTALTCLQEALQDALSKKDDTLALNATKAVMTWGGVRNGNVRWLEAHKEGLASMLCTVRDSFNQQNLNAIPKDLRFNAGMTKVYSLICDELIIYDSRVAAALGWIVNEFCLEKGLEKIPAVLAFPFAPAKESSTAKNPKNRNPNTHNLGFKQLRSGVFHAKWNAKASWLLSGVLQRAGESNPFKDLSSTKQLRAFESALFMIGYDLRAF